MVPTTEFEVQAAGVVHQDRPALRRCTHLDPAEFAATTWGRHASLSAREQLAEGFSDLLTLDDVDRLVSEHGLRTPFLRVARNGETYPNSRFTRGGGVGATIEDQVDGAALSRLYAEGATLVLQALHRTHPPLIAFARGLTADLGHPVQVNAYITPPQSQGFSDHYDVHDVFVLQVAGEKRWMIREPVHPHPLRNQPWTDRREAVRAAAQREPLLDVVLRPGDALYLPSGFLHAAQALGETSAHLTVGVHTWTRAHLVGELVARLGHVEALREPLPLGVDVTDPEQLQAALAETVRALQEALPQVPATEVARALGRQSDGATRAEPVGPLAQARAVDAVDLWSRLRWRHGLRATLADEPGGVVAVRTSEVTVRVPAAAREGVRRLLEGAVLTVAELAAGDDSVLDDVQRLEVARSLLTAAVAVPATGPAG